MKQSIVKKLKQLMPARKIARRNNQVNVELRITEISEESLHRSFTEDRVPVAKSK